MRNQVPKAHAITPDGAVGPGSARDITGHQRAGSGDISTCNRRTKGVFWREPVIKGIPGYGLCAADIEDWKAGYVRNCRPMRRVRLGAILLSQLTEPVNLHGKVMTGFSAVWRCLCRPSVTYESASVRSAPAPLARRWLRCGTCLSTFRHYLCALVATALLALPLLFGLTAETQAQNRVLVSTIGQTNAPSPRCWCPW